MTDVTLIKPLNDFPDTPYQTSIQNTSIRFRWIHAQCFQIQLPDGKVLMTDPFFPQNPESFKNETTPELNISDIGKVDYVTVNHSHVDHVGNIPDVFKENNPIVICDRIYARELSAMYEIPEYNIFPILPDMTYRFPSFKLDTIHGWHNNIGGCSDLEGKRFLRPNCAPLTGPMNSYGCLFNTNYLFTLTNNFKIGFAAGVDVTTMADAWKTNGSNLLLRQRLVYAKPEEYAKDCEALGGQLILPMHQDACFDWNSDMNAYANRVNQLLKEDGCPMHMINPERLKWYTVSMSIQVE